ncbi:MAG: glycosyltransferase family 4 protein, partial [Candidatus Bathyarchaeia archaeon]
FRRVKGPMFVIEAMRDISKSLKNVLLLFVGGKHPGDKFQSEIMEMAKSLPPNTIRFVENIPHLMLPDFYSAADVVVVPSLYDAFPKVVLEAMACGIPVVASDVGGIPEMVSHGRTGFLVEPCNSSRLAEALVSVLMDEDLKRRLASNAFRLVSNLYTWSNVARQVTAVYERLLND